MIKTLYILIGFALLIAFEASAQLTNHVEIKSGFYFELCDDSLSSDEPFESGEMVNAILSCTNGQWFYAKQLPLEQTYVFELHDKAGNIIPKTPLGVANSQPVDNHKAGNGHGFGGKYVAHNLFKPDDYFVITNTGIYTLQVQMRFWSEITNNQYGVITTPPVRVQIEKR